MLKYYITPILGSSTYPQYSQISKITAYPPHYAESASAAPKFPFLIFFSRFLRFKDIFDILCHNFFIYLMGQNSLFYIKVNVNISKIWLQNFENLSRMWLPEFVQEMLELSHKRPFETLYTPYYHITFVSDSLQVVTLLKFRFDEISNFFDVKSHFFTEFSLFFC